MQVERGGDGACKGEEQGEECDWVTGDYGREAIMLMPLPPSTLAPRRTCRCCCRRGMPRSHALMPRRACHCVPLSPGIARIPCIGEGPQRCAAPDCHMCAARSLGHVCVPVSLTSIPLASFPGHFLRGRKKRPGIHCWRMRKLFCKISVK